MSDADEMKRRARRLGVTVGQLARAERMRAAHARRIEALPTASATFPTPIDPPSLPPRVDEGGVRWVVALASPTRAREVAGDLADLGFRAYVPMGRRIAYRALSRSGRRVRAVQSFPVFGDYLFCGEGEERLTRRMHDRLVAILSDKDGSLAVPQAVIRAVNDAEMDGRWDCASPKAPRASPFAPGARVRVKEGPFAAFMAIVEEVERSGKVRIGLDLFGRRTQARVEGAALDLA